MTEESKPSSPASKPKNVPTHNKSACPECGSNNIEEDRHIGENVCGNCGLVLPEKIMARGPEQRTFDSEQRAKRDRSGPPGTYTIHDKGLSTVIDWRDKTRSGRPMTLEQRYDMYKLRKWQRRVRVQSAPERNLAISLSRLDKYSLAANLPKNIMETASVNYRRAIKKKIVRGRSSDAVVLASIYMACRQTGIARSLGEIAKLSETGASRKDIGRAYRLLRWEVETYDVKPLAYAEYGARICNKLKLSGWTESIALKILEAAHEAKLTSGRSPKGLPASAVYIACFLNDEGKTQREIAEIADVTEVTIRNRYKELMERFLIEVPL